MKRYIQIYDVELSSSNPDDGDILSLACIIVDATTLEKVDTLVEYGRPRDFSKWNSFAESIHKISKKKAESFQSQRELGIKLLHFLKPYKNENDNDPMPMVMHGINYVDYSFIVGLFKKVGINGSIEKVMQKGSVIRTDTVYRQYRIDHGVSAKPKPKANLKIMSEEFGYEINHHECLSDTEACLIGLQHMAKHYKDQPPLKRSGSVDFIAFNDLVNNYSG